MSASLVGSEMCIRDSSMTLQSAFGASWLRPSGLGFGGACIGPEQQGLRSLSTCTWIVAFSALNCRRTSMRCA
eukprot:9141151-Alexandrium_andersonii.AAC.1